MMAISLWQPWASLWLSERKVHETRHWRPSWSGAGFICAPLAVHAAKKFVKEVDGALRDILDDEFGGHWGMELATGALIGVVELVAFHPIGSLGVKHAAHEDDFICGDWSAGRFAWQRGTYRVFKQPIPWKGHQGFFNVPDDVIRAAA